jgi:hypothetical protein
MAPFDAIEQSLPREVYSDSVVRDAIREFEPWFHVQVVTVTPSEVTLRFAHREPRAQDEPPHIVAEFLNFALQLAAVREDAK